MAACDDRLHERALAIADAAMTNLLTTCAIPVDEHRIEWALCTHDGSRAATLGDADEEMIDAVKWLRERELCELVESPRGATVILLAADARADR